jgi:hypothetical protein
MYKIIIDLKSKNSAEHVRKEIEKNLPMLEGMVKIYKEPEIQPLSNIIDAEMKKFRMKH